MKSRFLIAVVTGLSFAAVTGQSDGQEVFRRRPAYPYYYNASPEIGFTPYDSRVQRAACEGCGCPGRRQRGRVSRYYDDFGRRPYRLDTPAPRGYIAPRDAADYPPSLRTPPISSTAPNYVVADGAYGQPVVYVEGQTFRNLLKSLTP